MGVGILGVGYAAPEKIVTNSDLAEIVDTSDEWIATRTGIRERRIAEKGKSTSDWAYKAALQAIKNANIDPKKIDLIVVGTTTPDRPLPSCACTLQHRLGVGEAACFDLSAACSGFIYALSTAQQFIQTKAYKTALVVGADQISSFIDWKDRSTCVLFGDAAGACIVESVPGRGIIFSDLGSSGEHADLIHVPSGGSKDSASNKTIEEGGHYLKMNGAEVFKHAVRGMAQSIENVLKKTNTSIDQIKWVIPHQANLRIIDAIGSRLNIDREKIYINLDRYGNTSAASVIVAFSEAVERGLVNKGDLLLLTTFGAGLVWGTTLIEW